METKVEIKTNEHARDYTNPFNKFAYVAFIVLGIVLFIINHSYSDLVANLGISLVFDPFDQKVAWPQRPFYQKALPVVQLAIIAAAFGMMVAGR